MTIENSWLLGKLEKLTGFFRFSRPHIESNEAASIAPVQLQTPGEIARADMAKTVLEFARIEDATDIGPADLEVNEPLDWSSARQSLINHGGIKKAIRITTSVACQSLYWQLHNFDYLYPEKWIAEVQTEIGRCVDKRLASKFESRISAFKIYLESMPLTASEKRIRAAKLIENTEYATNALINFCKIVVSQWLEKIPDAGMGALLAELERLEHQKIKVKLQWFGLAEFALTEKGGK
jgi:hypothetical protein